MLLVYIDDILIIGNSPQYIDHLIKQLDIIFSHKDLNEVHYFLGVEVKRLGYSMLLRQTKYITDFLGKTKLEGAKPISTPMFFSTKLFQNDSE